INDCIYTVDWLSDSTVVLILSANEGRKYPRLIAGIIHGKARVRIDQLMAVAQMYLFNTDKNSYHE
ncbi:MAG: hypothetical protein ABUT20_54700, partial [Bacteroidota bacterium]